MEIGYLTNSTAPYRVKQINTLSKIKNIEFNIYYTKPKGGRAWDINDSCVAKEFYLRGIEPIKFKRIDFCINFGLIKLIRRNDLIVIGGYEQPSYLLASIICKLFKKKYILLFDGIQPQKIGIRGNFFKYIWIKYIVKNSLAIFSNGLTSKLYFNNNFKYDAQKIYNQYLTVDIDSIDELYRKKEEIKKQMRESYAIENNKKVLLYVGRLLDWKNVDTLINAVSLIKNHKEYILFIVGDGPERMNLEKLSQDLKINTYFIGNISDPYKIYKHYIMADLFIFPTSGEAWGLVVNEALAAGLPVVCAKSAGCSLDLVIDDRNGYTFNYDNPNELGEKINKVFSDKDKYNMFCIESKRIIKEWTFENSRESFERMLIESNII